MKRIYDKPMTSYQRLLDHSGIDEEIKSQLRQKYITLNPSALIKKINLLVNQLISE